MNNETAYCYILYSTKSDHYYIGMTGQKPEDRLKKHLDKYYKGAHFTEQADDWELYHVIDCANQSQARQIEAHIKKMKSRIFIQNLKKYPAITKKLLERYK